MSKPCSVIELKISCHKLANRDILSKSDPLVIVKLNNVEIGRTETIQDSLNPQFSKGIRLNYYFEEIQNISFDVVDYDGAQKYEALGCLMTTVAHIVSAKGKGFQRALDPKGTIRVVATEVGDPNMIMKLRLAGKGLDKKDFFGKSDPYFELHRVEQDGSTCIIHRSTHLLNTLDPQWPEIAFDPHVLCLGNLSQPILFRVYDWDKNSDNDLIGECSTNIQEIMKIPHPQLKLVHPKNVKKGKSSGTLIVQLCTVERLPSFLEYLAGGTELNLSISIDFTASNGDPRDSQSLHFVANNNSMNSYQKAIWAVSNILQIYDNDKIFPVYGFGAKLPDNSVSHLFPLNGNYREPGVMGTEGIMAAYMQSLTTVKLHGPTFFAPTINGISDDIQRSMKMFPPDSKYSVLLIITDGEITDFPETVDAIVRASTLPLSIVIVGVGSADFSAMNALDGDNSVLVSSQGTRAKRDVVQFVSFRDFAYHDGNLNGEALSKAVLAEIPGQLVQFMTGNGIRPRPPHQSSSSGVH